jgi:hypothetical protein
MAKHIHKGTELNNVRETWERNESLNANTSGGPSTTDENLERVIKKEADDYENANKEDRLLSGDRASVDDGTGKEE